MDLALASVDKCINRLINIITSSYKMRGVAMLWAARVPKWQESNLERMSNRRDEKWRECFIENIIQKLNMFSEREIEMREIERHERERERERCLPVAFHFDVDYQFTEAGEGAGGCNIRRKASNLVVDACSCMTGCMIKSSLVAGLEKENAAMVRLVTSPP